MITVLTPTWNRAHTLKRVYESLCAQTDARFEWLVVDDGSTDGTAALLEQLQADARFPVRIVSQPNGGKHVAINAGGAQSAGEWVLILDSDDALVPEAVAAVHREIARDPGPDVSGLCFRKAYFDGRIVGRTDVREARLFLHPTRAGQLFKGDLAYVFRRSALRSHPFPVIPGEKFFPELYVWNLIGDDGRILFFPHEAIYLCEYLPDGYSANFPRVLKGSPRGFFIYYRAQVRREATLLRKVKCAVRALQCLGYGLVKRMRS